MFRNLMIRVVAVVGITFLMLSGAEGFLRVQHYVQLDGFDKEHPWNQVLHHGAGKFVLEDFDPSGSRKKIKLLLLGDSWMEDTHLGDAIGKELALKSGMDVEAINGGNSSYAPTIYMLKARQAYQKFGKFDVIVVNIDTTDIGDEWVRYKIPKYRDRTGRVVAVPFSRDLNSEYLWKGKLWAEDSDLYLVRLVKFAFFYKALVPMLYKLTYCPDYSTLMRYVFAPDARTRYAEVDNYFDDDLLEMANEISRYTNGPGSVYITHHPHKRELADPVVSGQRYLPIISEAMARVREKTGVKVIDAYGHAKEIHGEALLTDTFVKDDPFSHLNSEGATRYGKWIGDRIKL